MFARFVGSTGAITASNGGVLAVVRNGVGDYTVTLARPVAPGEVDVSITALDTTPRTHSIEHVSPTQLRVRFEQ